MDFSCGIEEFYPEVFKIYKEIVSISSASDDKEGVDKVGKIISEFMKERGFSVERSANEEAGDGIVVSFNQNNKGIKTVLLAHMDTVHKKESFTEPLFREQGEKVYGPGVLDCKGGIAVGLLTMLALKNSGYSAPVKLVLAPDEEISFLRSGKKGIDFIRDNVRDASYAFVLESGMKDRIVTARKGVVRYEVLVFGKAAHSGNAYDKGVSAIKEACKKILEIEKNSNVNKITYNCGIISGGKMPNSVPDICRFVVDVRFFSKEEEKEAEETIRGIVETSYFNGTKSEIKLLSRREPMEETKENLALFNIVKAESAKLNFEKFEKLISGGASDAAFSSNMGIPTLCGLGMVGRFQHTCHEEADIPSLKKRSVLIGRTIIKLSQGTDSS